MPTIPFTSRPQVAPSGTPTVSAPVAAFGVPSAVDLTGAQKLALEVQDRSDQTVLDDAELAHARLQTDLLTQATQAQGINALQAAQNAQEKYQSESARIIDALPNDRVKQLASHRAQGYFVHLYEATESHAAAETRKADAARVSALLKNDLEDVDHDPSTALDAVEKARARIADYGPRAGWDAATTEEKTAEHVSTIHAAAISRLVSSADAAGAALAGQYLADHRGELRGQQLKTAEKQVDAAQAQGVGFREADAILHQTGNPVADDAQQEIQQPLTMTQALAKAEALPDPRARKAATDVIVAHFSHLETAKRLDREAARSEVIKDAEAHGGVFNRASKAWLLIEGTPEGEQVLHRSEQLLKPAKDAGDPEAFMLALNMASVSPSTRADFLGMDFMEEKAGGNMNASQKKHLIDLQRHYRDEADRRAHAGTHTSAPVTPIRVDLHGEDPFERFKSSGATPARHATSAEIAGARRNPAYAAYLRNINVMVP